MNFAKAEYLDSGLAWFFASRLALMVSDNFVKAPTTSLAISGSRLRFLEPGVLQRDVEAALVEDVERDVDAAPFG